MTPRQRETATAVGRAIRDQELALFKEIVAKGGEAAERGLVQLMDDFDGASPEQVRAFDDTKLHVLTRMACVGVFTVIEARQNTVPEETNR